ncbi:hypothetical protein LDO26_05835 [Luteimonas sp. BDR2-5]|uniref:hypothetical protein n=1 Tax=Proluteimonas luteida TaxID=2878685 RepID=UPI001E5B296B|nr:hypothetical protein [Luteimonas sp. BDR2-5]MCD9027725.1 hypothetical protein [Luteimonas sp. BDR2-5]
MANEKKYPGNTKHPPADCAEKIRDWAAIGYSKKAMAYRFGVCAETMNRWLADDPELQREFEQGREREHQALFNSLFTQATSRGNVTAAIFLLKSRHGYREGDQSDIANRVSITFQLPGALPMDQYTKALEKTVGRKGKSNEAKVIEHGE